MDLDVITSARLKPGTLSSRPLHSLFMSARWERRPSPNHQRRHLYALPNHPGLSGNCKCSYTMIDLPNHAILGVFENDLVKNAMMPALQIASYVMESVHMLPWVGAVPRVFLWLILLCWPYREVCCPPRLPLNEDHSQRPNPSRW